MYYCLLKKNITAPTSIAFQLLKIIFETNYYIPSMTLFLFRLSFSLSSPWRTPRKKPSNKSEVFIFIWGVEDLVILHLRWFTTMLCHHIQLQLSIIIMFTPFRRTTFIMNRPIIMFITVTTNLKKKVKCEYLFPYLFVKNKPLYYLFVINKLHYILLE